MILVGPAGIGGKEEAISNLEYYKKNKITAAEVAFTYSIYLKKPDAIIIGKKAEELNIKLSVHAPYYINLNSEDKNKIEKSKQRILKSAEIANYLKAELIVFHPGYYGKSSKEETYQKIKESILDLQKEIKKNKYNVKLAPETTGKINVFGSVEEILKLVKETKCSFCLDFAHIYAREQGKITYSEILEKFKNFKHIHCHFSGIDFSSKGERNHKITPEKEIEKLIKAIKKSRISVEIINESPEPVKDSIKTLKYI